MNNRLPLYYKFISAPDFSSSRWSMNIIKEIVTKSLEDEGAKESLLKLLQDAERLDWAKVTFSAYLTPDMFGETAWAVAAMAMYFSRKNQYGGVKIDFNPNPRNEKQLPPLVTLQRDILASINPAWEKEGAGQKSAGSIQGWSRVNEVLLPLYLHTSNETSPLVEFHNCMRSAFGLPALGNDKMQTPLQTACEGNLRQWLASKGIKRDLTTVCIWVRSKLDPNNMGDAVNNLTQEHFQTILKLLKKWEGLGGQQVEQIILLGDQPDLKSKLYSDSPYNIATSASYFDKKGEVPVIDLLHYLKDETFKKIVAGIEGKWGGSMACQMLVCDLLRRDFGLQCLIGKKSGGMDGPSMISIRQIFFEEDGASDSRMGFTALLDPVWIQVPLVKREETPQKVSIHENNFFFPQEEQRFLEALELGIKSKKKQ
jgi:hypothetical protein